MTIPVREQLIFHITHIDNLSAILAEGCLWSDHDVRMMSRTRTVIGFDTIKTRRLEELPVSCHPGTFVGEYVPFYFCPRSPMLYVIHRRASQLSYQGGQEPIVHLVSRIDIAIEHSKGVPWAFTDGNAGARYTRFSNDLTQFDNLVDWNAVQSHYWNDPKVRERKQAEFLIYRKFPWTAVIAIGVYNQSLATDVQKLLTLQNHQPQVAVEQNWYY
jgi:hypothetical protein